MAMPAGMSAPQHRPSREPIVRRFEHAREVPTQPPPGIAREQIGRLAPAGRHVRLDGVRDGIVAGHRGDVARLRHGQLRIEKRDAERRFRIAAGHLGVRLAVGNERIDCASLPVPAVVGTPIDGSIGRVAFPNPR